jgi:hypothetical protein
MFSLRLSGSVKSHAVSPAVSARVDNDAIREWVGITGGDGWDMVFVTVDNT